MTFTQAQRFLHSFANYEKKCSYRYTSSFNLKRVRKLLAILGNPHKRLQSVIIGGTNGKGSTAAILQGILSGHSYRVGLYTSPHLVDIRERIRIGNKRISKSCFARECASIQKCIRNEWCAQTHGGNLTYFEIVTVVAIVYFVHESVDCALFEVGLGGRLDATNVLDPLFSIITSIGYDHEHILGTSLKRIAREKAGIIKKKSWLISAQQRPEVRQVLTRTAQRKKTKVLYYQRDFHLSSVCAQAHGWRFTYKGYKNLMLPLGGHFQLENAALALQAFELLQKHFSFQGTRHHTKNALKAVYWPGRFEIISYKPLMLVDGAHNPDAIAACISSIQKTYPDKDIIIIYAALKDKKVGDALYRLRKLSPSIIITRVKHDRAYEIKKLKKIAMKYFCHVKAIPSVKRAYTYARSVSAKDSLIVSLGSLFLVGEMKKIMRKAR